MRASGICRLPCTRALASRRGKGKKAVRVWWCGESLSSVFTQTRLFWPDGVKILFLMLTYMSTLRSKTGFFLVRQKNAYFANSLNTSHRLRFALASIRKATPRPTLWYLAEAAFARRECGLWHLRVAEGDRLSERSEGGKLPQHKTRALAALQQLKTFFGGAPGGVQRGSRRGAAPSRPPLPHAGEASKTSPRGEMLCPQGRRNQSSLAGEAKSHAAQASQTSPEGEILCPAGQQKSKDHIPAGRRNSAPQATSTTHPTHTTQASTHQGC